jgi:paraquat-inducible protein B
MSDMSNESKLPSAIAEAKRRWAPQLIWIIPIIAIVVGLNLAYQATVNQGPVITIAFKSGDGLEAGKTVIQYKGVNIGLVKKVTLSNDNQVVIATAQLNKEAGDFAKEDTRFWIVRPQITASGVSGLSTLLSGPFISAELGKASSTRSDFVALEVAPILTAGIPGREFTLKAPTLGSHDVGTQVYFRRLVVGEVIAYDLDKQGKDISIKVFIHAPYDQYVTKNTRFWNASGIDLTVGATGIQLQTESLVAVVAGGIAFEAPPAPSDSENGTNLVPGSTSAVPATELADANSTFQLFQTRALAMKQPDSVTQSYVVNFKQSVKGLSVGAPVEFRGVNIGEVVSIGLSIDPKTFELVQPVEFSLYPQRLHARSSVTGEHIPFPKTRPEQLKRIKAFIDHGLRVQLRSSSLLTGQQYLAVDMFPDAPKYTFDISKSPLQMQYVPGAFDNIEQSISSTIKNADALIKKLDSELIPELSQSLKNINAITAGDSPLQIDIRDSLREISKAASSVKTLTDMLEQQPQSLIFGKPAEGSK